MKNGLVDVDRRVAFSAPARALSGLPRCIVGRSPERACRAGRGNRSRGRSGPPRLAPGTGHLGHRRGRCRRARAASRTGPGARRRRRGSRVARQAQIGRLARDGLSNPEIGARLFISPERSSTTTSPRSSASWASARATTATTLKPLADLGAEPMELGHEAILSLRMVPGVGHGGNHQRRSVIARRACERRPRPAACAPCDVQRRA